MENVNQFKVLVAGTFSLLSFAGLILGIYWFGMKFLIPYVMIIFGIAAKDLFNKYKANV